MLSIGEYIEFFSKWDAMFNVHNIDLPFGQENGKNGKQWEEVQWYCESINSLTPTLFDDKLIEFSSVIKEVENTISTGSSSPKDLLFQENWVFIRRKVEILLSKFITEPWEAPDPVRPYISQKCYFAIGEGLAIEQNYFNDYEIQKNNRWNQLLKYYPDFLTIYFWPFKKNLEILLPLLDVLVENGRYSASKLQSAKNTESKHNEPSKFLCFTSRYFRNDEVIETLYDYFVAKKNTIPKSGNYFQYVSMRDFKALFNYKEEATRKVILNWLGSIVGLRFFLIQIHEFFKIGEKHKDVYEVADSCILYRGEIFDHSNRHSKGNNPKPKVVDEIRKKVNESRNQFTAKNKKGE